MEWIRTYRNLLRHKICRHDWDRVGAVVLCRKCLKVDYWKTLENADVSKR